MKSNKQIFYLLFFMVNLYLVGCKTSNWTKFDTESSQVINDFLKQIGTPKYMDGLDNLLVSNPDINIKDSSVINLKDRFRLINEISGKYLGSTEIKKKKIKDDVAIYGYLLKYEKKFYRLVFIFYNVENNCKIYKFSFDEDLTLEMEESIKMYNF